MKNRQFIGNVSFYYLFLVAWITGFTFLCQNVQQSKGHGGLAAGKWVVKKGRRKWKSQREGKWANVIVQVTLDHQKVRIELKFLNEQTKCLTELFFKPNDLSNITFHCEQRKKPSLWLFFRSFSLLYLRNMRYNFRLFRKKCVSALLTCVYCLLCFRVCFDDECSA